MNYKVSLRRTLLTSVAAGAMALSATMTLSNDANAEAYALSVVTIENLDLTFSGGDALVNQNPSDLLFEAQATTGLGGIISGTTQNSRRR